MLCMCILTCRSLEILEIVVGHDDAGSMRLKDGSKVRTVGAIKRRRPDRDSCGSCKPESWMSGWG